MYSISAYGSMIADHVRMDAYVEALRRVAPNSIVVDLGAGTGILSLLSARFGARRVYAIEQDEVIQVARQIARDNGLSDKIEFIQNTSTKVKLPEKADVIVSDLRGVLPHYDHHIPLIVDARSRLLRDGGVMIPRRDDSLVAVVEAPELYEPNTSPLQQAYGFDHRFAERFVINTWWKGLIQQNQLLTKPECWATLDYSSIVSPDSQAEVQFRIIRKGTGHGIAIWFDTVLIDDVGFSTAPGCKTIYQNAFFPWAESVKLAKGDRVHLTLSAKLIGDDYMFRWQTRISRSSGQEKAGFDQSTFYGLPLNPETLRRTASNHHPILNEKGRIDRLILDLMNQNRSLGEIADELLKHFPESFKKWQDALTRAATMSQRYSG